MKEVAVKLGVFLASSVTATGALADGAVTEAGPAVSPPKAENHLVSEAIRQQIANLFRTDEGEMARVLVARPFMKMGPPVWVKYYGRRARPPAQRRSGSDVQDAWTANSPA